MTSEPASSQPGDIQLGQRVFVAGTVGKYGKVIAVGRGPDGYFYHVEVKGAPGTTGPFVDVWPAP